MLKVKEVVREVDGTVQATFSLTEDQVAFLLSYAVSDLVSKGLAEIEREDEHEQVVGLQ